MPTRSPDGSARVLIFSHLPSSQHTLRVAAGAIYRAAVSMRLDSSSQVSDVEEAAKDWATRPYGNGNQIGPERTYTLRPGERASFTLQ
jgi:hypothetical protein